MSPLYTTEPERCSSRAGGFEHQAEAVLRDTRVALAAILDTLRPPITRAATLRKRLELDQNLSWRIFNAATAHDPRTLPAFLPGRRAMERFLAAAAQHGVDATAIDAARLAFERFEESVARHARTRDAFVTMVAGIASPGDTAARSDGTSADARHKRSMFRAASLLLGRQARVCFGAMIVHPGSRAGLVDSVVVKGLIDLHQTRRGVRLHMVARQRVRGSPVLVARPSNAGAAENASPSTSDPALAHTPTLEALDPRESTPGSIGLLRDFCSQPLPTFRRRPPVLTPRSQAALGGEQGEGAQGGRGDAAAYADYDFELIAKGIGASSGVTYFTGHLLRACAEAPGSSPGAEMAFNKSIDMPIEVYICDVLMHRSLWDESLPDVKLYACSLDSPPNLDDAEPLPLTEKAVSLGHGLASGRTPLVPRYADMLSYALERVGWNPAEFRIFRCRVDHPVLTSRIRMTFAK